MNSLQNGVIVICTEVKPNTRRKHYTAQQGSGLSVIFIWPLPRFQRSERMEGGGHKQAQYIG